MPSGNFSYVFDSTFQPFSMQELLTPYLMYKDAFEKTEEGFSQLSDRARAFEFMASRLPEGSRAKAIYDNYVGDLKAMAADLSTRGLMMSNRGALTSLKRRYSSEIGRLEKIDAIRRAQIQEQRNILAQDPTRMFSRRADLTDFDEYLDNPDLSYESYSGAMLTQQVATAAQAIAKSLREYGQGKPLDKFTNIFLKQHGFTAAEVAEAISNPTNAKNIGILNTLVENVIANSGIKAWATPDIMQKAYAFARQGLWSAVGQTDVDKYENYGARLAAQTAAQDMLNARQHARSMAAQRAAQAAAQVAANQRYRQSFTPKNIYTSEEIAQIQRDKNAWNRYKNYFQTKKGSDGKIYWEMTKAGREFYTKGGETRTMFLENGDRAELPVNDAANNFRSWVNFHGISNMAKGGVGPNMTANINAMVNRINGVTDANRATEYWGIVLDPSQYDNVIASLGQAADRNGKVRLVERAKDKNNNYIWKDTDKTMVIDDIKKDNIVSVYPIIGSHGNVYEITLTGGKKIDVKVSDFNQDINNLVTGNINDALALEKQGANPIQIVGAIGSGIDNMYNVMSTGTVENTKFTPAWYTGIYGQP